MSAREPSNRHAAPGAQGFEDRRGLPAYLAQFASLADARAVILALESSGVDGVDVSLVGDRAQSARESQRLASADRRMGRVVAGRAVSGTVAGSAAGALIGAIVGAIIAAFVSSNGWAVFAGCIVGGILLGSMAGALVGVERGTGFSESWLLTFEDAPAGPVWLAVWNDSDRVATTLSDAAALAVRKPHDLDEVTRTLRRSA